MASRGLCLRQAPGTGAVACDKVWRMTVEAGAIQVRLSKANRSAGYSQPAPVLRMWRERRTRCRWNKRIRPRTLHRERRRYPHGPAYSLSPVWQLAWALKHHPQDSKQQVCWISETRGYKVQDQLQNYHGLPSRSPGRLTEISDWTPAVRPPGRNQMGGPTSKAVEPGVARAEGAHRAPLTFRTRTL